MPAAVIPFRSATTAARRGTWSLLELARPGYPVEPLGILLLDAETGALSLRLRDESDFEDLEDEEADFLAALEADLKLKGQESGRALLDSLEDSLSNFLRIGNRTAIEYSGEAGHTVNRLFDEHVDGEVRPFVTHIPVYALRAAATKFGDEFDQAEVSKEPEACVSCAAWSAPDGGYVYRSGSRPFHGTVDSRWRLLRLPRAGGWFTRRVEVAD